MNSSLPGAPTTGVTVPTGPLPLIRAVTAFALVPSVSSPTSANPPPTLEMRPTRPCEVTTESLTAIPSSLPLSILIEPYQVLVEWAVTVASTGS